MIDNKYSTYSNPLTERYCSKNMSYIFSPQFKFSTWRKLWIALAEGEKELGINMNYLGEVIDNPNIKDKSFVITGTLNIKRDELKDKIITNGGKVIDSVSKKTDYLIL